MGYFRPLRRKIGVLTLLMALAFMTGWIRSCFMSDHLGFSTKSYPLITFSSRLGILDFSWFDEGLQLKTNFQWSSNPIPKNAKADPKSNRLFWWEERPLSTSGGSNGQGGNAFSIQYSVIAVPLTLLSAWLLLSRPRAKRAVNHQVPSTPPNTNSNPLIHCLMLVSSTNLSGRLTTDVQTRFRSRILRLLRASFDGDVRSPTFGETAACLDTHFSS